MKTATAIGMGLFVLLTAVLSSTRALAGGSLYRDWVRTYRLDPAKANAASKIAITSEGIVVAGTSANSTGSADYVVINYNRAGDVVWTQRYDTGGDDSLRDLTTDSKGSVFITGTSDTVKYSGAGDQLWTQPYAGRALKVNSNFVYVTGFSATQYATAQLTNNATDGGVGWVRTLNPTGDEDISAAIALSPTGDVLIAGWETLGVVRGSAVMNEFLFCSYSDNGALRWQFATNQDNGFRGHQGIYGLEFDAVNSAYAFGSPEEAAPKLIRINPDGSVAWMVTWTFVGLGCAMKIAPDNGVICVGGNQAGSVARFSPQGAIDWTQVYSTPSGQSGATCVDVSASGNVYVAGYTFRTFLDNDMFVMKLSSDGLSRTSIVYDSPAHGSDSANAIAVDKNGDIYVTGYSTTAEGGSEFVTIKYSERPKIEKASAGAMHIEFLTDPNSSYSIEGTFDFIDWDTLFTGTSDSSGIVQFDDPDATVFPNRVYRGKSP